MILDYIGNKDLESSPGDRTGSARSAQAQSFSRDVLIEVSGLTLE
jgi:hypothetical protein